MQIDKAFPRSNGISNDGMDLRDYFAAKALMSMLGPVQNITDGTPKIAAEYAYKFADAMLKARKSEVNMES